MTENNWEKKNKNKKNQNIISGDQSHKQTVQLHNPVYVIWYYSRLFKAEKRQGYLYTQMKNKSLVWRELQSCGSLFCPKLPRVPGVQHARVTPALEALQKTLEKKISTKTMTYCLALMCEKAAPALREQQQRRSISWCQREIKQGNNRKINQAKSWGLLTWRHDGKYHCWLFE